jgi:hypothetical protein
MTKLGWRILLVVTVVFGVFLAICQCYYAYKALTARCRVCGERIEGQWGKKMWYVYIPWNWRKIKKFVCLDCKSKK